MAVAGVEAVVSFAVFVGDCLVFGASGDVELFVVEDSVVSGVVPVDDALELFDFHDWVIFHALVSSWK